MRDPRVDELLEFLDETTSRGNPTRQAEMAARVQGLLFEIEKLRSEVEVANRQVVALAAREATLKQSMAVRSGASLAAAGASSLADDEPEFEFVRERLETVSSNLQARRQFVKHAQDLLAARVNEVQKILDSFAGSDAGAARTRRVRRIRRVRRRR